MLYGIYKNHIVLELPHSYPIVVIQLPHSSLFLVPCPTSTQQVTLQATLQISEHVGIPFRVCRVGNPFIVQR